MSRKQDDAELDFACETVMNRASEHNLVALLDKLEARGRTRGKPIKKKTFLHQKKLSSKIKKTF